MRIPKMKRAVISLLLACPLGHAMALAQGNVSKEAPVVTLIKAGRLIDVRAGRTVENQGILVERERIKSVGPLAEVQRAAPASAQIVDLSHATVMPGLADCHVHVLLQGDVTIADYDEQLLKESIPYRTI